MSDLEISDNEIDNELSEEEIIEDEFTENTDKKKNFDIKSVKKTALENDDEDDDDDDDDDDDFYDEIENKEILNETKTSKSSMLINDNVELPTTFEKNDSDYESDSDESYDDEYLQKIDNEVKENFILKNHPETQSHNYDEISKLSKVVRDKDKIIVDDLHKTIPILTKYEKTRILGIRAKQINNGSKPYIKFERNVIDGYLIAVKELEEKKLPFIVRRPLPNGGSEYWKLKDLEII